MFSTLWYAIGEPELIQMMIKLFSRSCQCIGKFYNSRSVMMSESLHEHQHDSQIQHLVHTDARPYHMRPIIFVEEELFWWYLLWHARNLPFAVEWCQSRKKKYFSFGKTVLYCLLLQQPHRYNLRFFIPKRAWSSKSPDIWHH